MTTTAEKMGEEAATKAAEVPKGIVPYVSTTLHTIWLPDSWSTLGWVYSTAGDSAKPMTPHYQVTPDVYAWLRRQVGIADDKAAANGDGVLAEQVRVLAGRWVLVADWAEAEFSADERAKAVPRLPDVTVELGTVEAARGRPDGKGATEP